MEGPLTPRLKLIRRQRKLTQVKMAMLLGLSRSTYTHYELGMRQPTIEQLVDMAAILGISLDYLTGITDFALTVDSAVKFGVLKKLRAIRDEDIQPYTPANYNLPRVAENNPGSGDGYEIT